MPRRPQLPTSDQTTLVDTFTCSIAILFVLILSLRANSTRPYSVVLPDLVLICSSREADGEPLFRFSSEEPGTPLGIEQTLSRLGALVATEALSTRVTVAHGPTDAACGDTARKMVDEYNEVTVAGSAGGRTERPYLILDLVARAVPGQPATGGAQ